MFCFIFSDLPEMITPLSADRSPPLTPTSADHMPWTPIPTSVDVACQAGVDMEDKMCGADKPLTEKMIETCKEGKGFEHCSQNCQIVQN